MFAVAAISGCPSIGALDSAADDTNGSGSGGAPGQGFCVDDSECVPAANKCCECPTFAVRVDDPAHQACSGVMCPTPMPNDCKSVVARCVQDHCELRCTPVVCPTSCPLGFARDPMTGCLTCGCAQLLGECTKDTECVETRKDCCGCGRGGTDTAVVAAKQAAFDASLQCPPVPSCPNVNTCTDQVPRCVQGACALVEPTTPSLACGRDDLPKCPTPSQCVVNANESADMQGLGVCQ
jgi:hypothetical protein